MNATSSLLYGCGLRRCQRGVVAVEFALVALVFITLLVGIMDFGRWMFTLNVAGEATRWGAHMAAVCSMDSASKTSIRRKMSSILPGVTATADDSQISITYVPAGCDPSTCETVLVQLANVSFTPLMLPFISTTIKLPPFKTSLPWELMNSLPGNPNPVCPG